MITILSAILAFSSVALLLTVVIIIAEEKLVSKGMVKIVINGEQDKALEVESGATLLSTLAGNGIFLPSACGGGGTCGTCRCQVFEGGGDILPTELGHISRRLAKDHWRLSCQVKVREDMEIGVPEEIFSIKKWECEVVSNDNVATFIKEFVVKLPEGETLDFEPGGYIQLDVPQYEIDYRRDITVQDKYRGEWERLGLYGLKSKSTQPVFRAYSMANHPAEGNIIKLNVRIATPPWDRERDGFKNVPTGIASSYIFRCEPGDRVTISGPYGDFFIQDTDREMVYIGGGAGMAPLRSHIFHLFYTLKTKRKVSYWYGARSKQEIFYEKDFRKIEKKFSNFSFHIALSEPLPEDNWKGYTGFIHNVVYENYLEDHPAPEEIEYYLCGPPVMLNAVKGMLSNLGVEDEMIRYDEFS
jgi:Na+-transporting NADH:ubiquinone oxidoreductase subunit F